MLRFERQYWDMGYVRIAGVDEAGRGSLAGPVVASAVVFEKSFIERESSASLLGLTDSKKLSEGKREFFYDLLTRPAEVEIGVGICGTDEIDSLNILRATHLAMSRAISDLPVMPDYSIVDGLPVKGLPCGSAAIVDGDSKSLSIAAASVVAKVVRDAHMRELGLRYPEYGFAVHKGYGTEMHMQKLFEHGPSPIHRSSFRPVREAAEIKSRAKRNDSH